MLQNLLIKLGSSSIIAGREDGSHLGLECTMKSLKLNAKFQPTAPELYLALNVDGISVRGKLPVLSLRSLSVESEVIIKLFCYFILLLYLIFFFF